MSYRYLSVKSYIIMFILQTPPAGMLAWQPRLRGKPVTSQVDTAAGQRTNISMLFPTTTFAIRDLDRWPRRFM